MIRTPDLAKPRLQHNPACVFLAILVLCLLAVASSVRDRLSRCSEALGPTQYTSQFWGMGEQDTKLLTLPFWH